MHGNCDMKSGAASPMANQTEIKQIDAAGYMESIGRRARSAAVEISNTPTDLKNRALHGIADQIEQDREAILEANAVDMAHGREVQLTAALLDRLELNPERIAAMAAGCRQVAGLADPVGEMTSFNEQPSGIKVGKMRVPIGVIGIIYESRPNVTIDAAVLCLKAGNAVILRGGSEAINSNLAIARCIRAGLIATDLSEDCVQVIETTDRAVVGALITADEFVDIIIPRGGKNLIERVSKEATVPVIKHLDGICHVYIDDDADPDKAIRVAFNAKARRFGVCGAMETLLVAESMAATVLPALASQFADEGIELRGCEKSRKLISQMIPATEQDWATEYLDGILSIRVVDGVDQAIDHINHYGSHHTDSIVTENKAAGERFLRQVDSSSVMLNASTQFADGFEYGLGAEIGISTNKLHVRGPVGLEGLTSQKYVVIGNGSIRH